MEGETLKKALADSKISISEAARRLGMSQSTLSAALQNDDVRTGLLEKIAEIVGKSPAVFYAGDNSAIAVATGAQSQATANVQRDAGFTLLADQLGKKDREIAEKNVQMERRDKNVQDLIDIIRGMQK